MNYVLQIALLIVGLIFFVYTISNIANFFNFSVAMYAPYMYFVVAMGLLAYFLPRERHGLFN